MDAREICKLAKSDEHFKTYFKEFFSDIESQAKKGISFIEYNQYGYCFDTYINKYPFNMKPEQEQYLLSLGYKIERYDHPTRKAKTFEVRKRWYWFDVLSEIEIPMPIIKISACCGDES